MHAEMQNSKLACIFDFRQSKQVRHRSVSCLFWLQSIKQKDIQGAIHKIAIGFCILRKKTVRLLLGVPKK